MKKLLFAATLLLALAATAAAQRGEQAQARIEAYKIAFFTEKLQLTPEESQAFWPLYNQFENERDALRDKYDLKGKKLELMSDAEVEDFVMGHLQMEEDLTQLRRNYVLRFKEVLPIRKVAMLPNIDREFKQELLREIQRRRQGGNTGPNRLPGGG